ncbi:ARM repeat-containing protein [Piromyces finnis]|uniref:ARM repeat-containing protein n=1 Tax=Piromyces finnis TaxID=1754191 RepID=A0A1Y1UMV4_9FUNG|nr:ARM repeat-containing protein [Piromyces finnis]|eukprot:ORX38796.1 ARM repeat-containing protein [Piromyces finnis]
MMTEFLPDEINNHEMKELTQEQEEKFNEVLMNIQRDINIISEISSDRLSKRRSLEKIKKETIGNKKGLSIEILQKLFFNISNALVRCLGDSIEKCRELSTQIITEFFETIDPIPFISYIMPVFVNRYSQPEIIEPSEEIRLATVELILKISDISKREITPFVEDIVRILDRTLQDSYPEVKKVSCKIIISLVENAEHQVSFFGEKITKSLVPTLQHKHSSVRIIALQALKYAVIADASGLNDIINTLRNLTLDKTGSVREVLYKTVSEWLLKLRDRYSYGDKLLPLLFAGFVDEVPKYQEQCKSYMNEIGALYEYDWESRLKDQLDYTPNNNNSDRPRIGSRHIVRDNIMKILDKLLEDIQDWTTERRNKSSQILVTLFDFVEEHITGYTNAIIPIFCKVCTTDEISLLQSIGKSSELLGRYVEPSVWLDVITPQIKRSAGGAVQSRIGCLKVLGSLIRGSDPEKLSSTIKYISVVINENELIHNENAYLLLEVSVVLQEIINKLIPASINEAFNSLEDSIGFKYFYILVQLKSTENNVNVPGVKEMQHNIDNSLKLLTEKHDFESIPQLYNYYFDTLMNELTKTIDVWNSYSIEPKVYYILLENSDELIGQRLDIIISNFVLLFNIERDFETRIRMFSLLHKLLKTKPLTLNSTHQLPMYSKRIITDIFIANGIWRAGKKATVIRARDMECFLAYLNLQDGLYENTERIINIQCIEDVMEKELLPVLISCLEDDDINTRENVLKIFVKLFNKEYCGAYNAELFKKIYPELLKRMDDASDVIRNQTAKTFPYLFNCIAQWQDYIQNNKMNSGESYIEKSLDDIHYQTMIKGLSIHLDDSNNIIQNAVCETFKGLALASHTSLIPMSNIPLKTMIIEYLNSVRSKHRNSYYIDNIIQYIQNLK